MPALILLLFFVFFAVIMLAFGVGFKVMETHQQHRVKQFLKTVSAAEVTVQTTVATPAQGTEFAAVAAELSPLLAKVRPLQQLNAAIGGAALRWRVESVLITMLGLALAGGFAGYQLNPLMFPWVSGVAAAGALGSLPVLIVNYKRNARLAAFEKQFPEALDFVARSVRAGHALSISLELLANESEAPLGVEFRRLTNELNLGTPFDVGMRNLVERVPMLDVRCAAPKRDWWQSHGNIVWTRQLDSFPVSFERSRQSGCLSRPTHGLGSIGNSHIPRIGFVDDCAGLSEKHGTRPYRTVYDFRCSSGPDCWLLGDEAYCGYQGLTGCQFFSQWRCSCACWS